MEAEQTGGTGAGAGDVAGGSAGGSTADDAPDHRAVRPIDSRAPTPVEDGLPLDVGALDANPNAPDDDKGRAPRRPATRKRTQTGDYTLVTEFKKDFPHQLHDVLGFKHGPDGEGAFPIVSGGAGPTASVTLSARIALAGDDPKLASVMLTSRAVAYQPVRSRTLTLTPSPLDDYLPPTSLSPPDPPALAAVLAGAVVLSHFGARDRVCRHGIHGCHLQA